MSFNPVFLFEQDITRAQNQSSGGNGLSYNQQTVNPLKLLKRNQSKSDQSDNSDPSSISRALRRGSIIYSLDPSVFPDSNGSEDQNQNHNQFPSFTNQGSVVVQASRGNRRLSTFSNLPIESRLGENINVEEIMNTLEGKYENTYRLNPIKGVPNCEKLRNFVKDLVETELADFSGTYSPFTAKYYAKILADQVKHEIKDTKNDDLQIDKRYKIITMASIGEKNDQDLRIKSGFMWDKERDRYFDVSILVKDQGSQSHSGSGIFIVIQVYLIYFD